MSTVKKATIEDAWEIVIELGKAQQETARQLKESTLELKEAQRETDRQLKETDRQLKETDHRFNSQWGKLVESLVEGDITHKFTEWGIEVQGTTQRAKKLLNGKEYEFDIIVHNGAEIIVVEVKTTLDVKKVDHFIGKLTDFKKIFPEYADKKIYGAVAYIVADSGSDKYSENKKLFVLKATGNSSIIVNAQDFRPRAF